MKHIKNKGHQNKTATTTTKTGKETEKNTQKINK